MKHNQKSAPLILALAIAVLILTTGISGCFTGNTVKNNNQEPPKEWYIDNPEKVVVYYFWGEGCPQCVIQREFLDEIEDKYPEVEIKSFETWRVPANYQIFSRVAQAYGITPRGVPTTFIGDRHWIGFSSALGSQMEEKINHCISNDCTSPGQKVIEHENLQ